MTQAKKLTLKEAQKQAREIGMTIKKNEYDEYVVNFRGGKEATAGYQNDLEDALGTARAMAAHRDSQK